MVRVLPVDLSLSGPSGQTAKPTPSRSPGAERLPVLSRGPPGVPPRSSPREPARQSSSPAARNTPASPGSAWSASAGRSSRHGHTAPPATFSTGFVPGRKRGRILLFRKPVFWAFQDVTQPWPPSIDSGHAWMTFRNAEKTATPEAKSDHAFGHPEIVEEFCGS